MFTSVQCSVIRVSSFASDIQIHGNGANAQSETNVFLNDGCVETPYIDKPRLLGAQGVRNRHKLKDTVQNLPFL